MHNLNWEKPCVLAVKRLKDGRIEQLNWTTKISPPPKIKYSLLFPTLGGNVGVRNVGGRQRGSRGVSDFNFAMKFEFNFADGVVRNQDNTIHAWQEGKNALIIQN